MSVAAAVALSDVGRKRSHNEDAVVAEDPLFAVADGVGGAAAGEMASSMALAFLARHAHELVAEAGGGDVAERMRDLVVQCNAHIYERQQQDAARAGMATTLTAIVSLGAGRVVIGHVGDSRAYRILGNEVTQVTDDHSIVGEMVRSGKLTERAAHEHPQRNVITRALGAEDHVDVDTHVLELEPGEWLLACSDGLTNYVDDAELALALRNEPTPQRAAKVLVAQANRRGGADNISVVLVQPLATHADDAARVAQHSAGGAALDAVVDAGPAGEISDQIDVIPFGDPAAQAARQASQEGARERRERIGAAREDAGAGWRRWRALVALVVILLLAFTVGAVAWKQAYFLGEDDTGYVAIYQGFPADGLNQLVSTTDVLVADLTVDARRDVQRHHLRSLEDTERLADQMPSRTRPCVPGKLANDGLHTCVRQASVR